MRCVKAVPQVVWYGIAWLVGTAGLAARLGDTVGLCVWTSLVWPMVVVGYRAGWRWSALLAVVANGLGAGLVGLRLASSAVMGVALASTCLPGTLALAMAGSRRRQQAWEAQRQVAQGLSRSLEQRQRALHQTHETLERTMGQLAGLYELTKRLLATLDRLEASRYLADALTGTFPQAVFHLCFVKSGEDGGGLDQVLRLQGDGIGPTSPIAADRWLLERLTRQPAVWSAWPSVGVSVAPAGDMPLELRTATAFPLVMDEALRGFLVAIDLAPDAVERCGILVSQFALAARRIRLYERVQELAIHDGLTGVFIRRHFLARLHEEVGRSARRGLPLAFLMVDIDHFKPINDTHGHLVGDAVLRELAAILRTQIRDVDLLGRYGGEEFALGLPETDAPQGQLVAERIRRAVMGAMFRAYDERLSITVSIGVAAFPRDAADASELVERADAAMYRAKLAGRNQACLFGA